MEQQHDPTRVGIILRSEKDPRSLWSCGIRLWDQILKGRERWEGERSGESEGMLADGSVLAKGRKCPAGVCFTVGAWLSDLTEVQE